MSEEEKNEKPEQLEEIPEGTQEELDLQAKVKEPFKSPEEAGMRMATVLARMFELAASRFLRVHMMTKKTPGAKVYFTTFVGIVDSGVKIISAMQTAYKWDEAIRRLRTALEEIKKLREQGLISEAQYQEALRKTSEMEKAAENA